MAIGCHQPVCDDEAGAGNPRAQTSRLVRKSDLVDAKNVTNRIAITVQNHDGHGLFLFKKLYLLV